MSEQELFELKQQKKLASNKGKQSKHNRKNLRALKRA